MRMIFKDYYDGTIDSLQKVLTSLKEKSYSQAQAVRLIMAEMKLSLVDADKIVIHSIAWSGEKGGNELFRENFRQALQHGKGDEDPDITSFNIEIMLLKAPE
jgi:hypothetical protein